MEAFIKDIPKEYLALKINYCRQRLKELPKVDLKTHMILEVPTQLVIVGNHKYRVNSPKGEEYLKIMKIRANTEKQLQLYESIWDYKRIEDPQPEFKPHKVIRTMYVDTDKRVVLDKKYFDSLKNDADTNYPKPKDYPFDGILYRSAAERDIAICYTEMGIPFKYEPEVMIKGLPKPIYPDFVAYIEELDNCKFHEHFGMKNSSNYLRITNIKYNNYMNAGLVPELDILFTYDVEEIPFDIRTLFYKFTSAVLSTMISTKHLGR